MGQNRPRHEAPESVIERYLPFRPVLKVSEPMSIVVFSAVELDGVSLHDSVFELYPLKKEWQFLFPSQ